MLKRMFLCTEGIIYVLFLFLDLTGKRADLSEWLKYSGILLCFFYLLAIKRVQSDHHELCCARLGMAGTLLADYCLLLHDYETIGVLCFIMVQSIYLYRFYTGKAFGIELCKNILAAIGVICLFYFVRIPIDFLLVITVVYFLSLVHNVVIAIRKSRILGMGMVLFLLCDLNVGLYNIRSYVETSGLINELVTMSSHLMWAFYLPSQVLISLSMEEKKR
ncbi:hypothetical protein lbkm_1877 [Lachnospiraceae bacterium KM106-2]|nr:hypothetical protein lbkm_1877 [Lachnospiraceae bacterium KM106-2]